MPNESSIWSRLLDRYYLRDIFRLPQPPLIDRGFGLIYDTERNITWLQDVNYARTVGHSRDGQMTWPDAMAWVASLNYRGITGWRLPNARNPDGSGPAIGNNCGGSEIGHLYLDVFTNHPHIVEFKNGNSRASTGLRPKPMPTKPMPSISPFFVRVRFGRTRLWKDFPTCRYPVPSYPGRCTMATWPRKSVRIGYAIFLPTSETWFGDKEICATSSHFLKPERGREV